MIYSTVLSMIDTNAYNITLDLKVTSIYIGSIAKLHFANEEVEAVL